MCSLPAYEQEPYRTELETVVVRVGEEGGRPYAVLSDTVLFPEGGGQPADRGFLDRTAVLDVQKTGEEVRHFLASPILTGAVQVRLDWSRRFDHMQQHTGQHVLTAMAQERFGWETTAFHLGEERCDIELATLHPIQEDLDRLEEAVAGVIREARAITSRRVELATYQTMQVRSRGLPEGHSGDVRLVEIEGLDLNTCGGTHLSCTSELECLKLLGTEPVRNGTRLFFIAGVRARRRMAAHEQRNADLRSLLGSPDEALVATVAAKLEQLRAAGKRLRLLEDEQLASQVQALAACPGPILEQHFEGRDAGFLQKAARQLAASAPGKAVFLTSSSEGLHFFVLATGADAPLDTVALGREVAGLLEAKGGGAKGFFQGKASSLLRRPEVLECLARALD